MKANLTKADIIYLFHIHSWGKYEGDKLVTKNIIFPYSSTFGLKQNIL